MEALLRDLEHLAGTIPDQDLSRDSALLIVSAKLAAARHGNYRLMLAAIAATCLVAIDAYDRKQEVIRAAIRRGPPCAGLVPGWPRR